MTQHPKCEACGKFFAVATYGGMQLCGGCTCAAVEEMVRLLCVQFARHPEALRTMKQAPTFQEMYRRAS